MMDIRSIALRDALRNDLPRLAARQEELENSLTELANSLKDDPMGAGFRLAARFPELRGLMPILSSINLMSVDELYAIAEQHKVPDGTIQAAASIGGQLLKENPLLMAALHRIFPLRESSQTEDKSVMGHPEQSKPSAVANFRGILAGRLWFYAENENGKGSFGEAAKALEQAVELAHEAGDWLLEAWALWKLAQIDPSSGTPQSFAEMQKTSPHYFSRARDYYTRALYILDTTLEAQGSRDADNLRVRLLLLLCATTLNEKPKEALQHAQRAHAIGIHLQSKTDIFEALAIGGTALVLLDEPASALVPLLRARSIAIELNDNRMMSRALMQLANAWGLMNHFPLASATMTASILLDPDDLVDNLSEQRSDIFVQLREFARRLEQEGQTESFLKSVNHGIDHIASQLADGFSNRQKIPETKE